MTSSTRGKNQKISGDALQKDIYDFIKSNYPNSSVEMEAVIFGTLKKSMKTGKIKPKRNRIDILWDDIAISAKNQNVAGTAEQKLIYEMCMIRDYMDSNPLIIKKAYIIYNGNGMKMVKEELDTFPIFKSLKKDYFGKIDIISFDDFKERYGTHDYITPEMGRR